MSVPAEWGHLGRHPRILVEGQASTVSSGLLELVVYVGQLQNLRVGLLVEQSLLLSLRYRLRVLVRERVYRQRCCVFRLCMVGWTGTRRMSERVVYSIASLD